MPEKITLEDFAKELELYIDIWRDFCLKRLGRGLTDEERGGLIITAINCMCEDYDVYVSGANLEEKIKYVCMTLNVEEEYFRELFKSEHYSKLKSPIEF